MLHLLKHSYIPVLFFFTSYTQAQEMKGIINQNLYNSKITASYEDTASFRTKQIYAVRNYKTFKKTRLKQVVKMFKDKPFTLADYTEYLPDGRKRYKNYFYETIERTEKYHYDSNFNNLILVENKEDNKAQHYQNSSYNWLFYDKNGVLNENFGYSNGGNGRLIYNSYIKYNVQYLKAQTKVSVVDYGSDTVVSPIQTYVFTPAYITKALPEYQSKWQKFIPINGTFKPVETRGYVIEDRNVTFTYDEKGFLTSEVWYKANHRLENKTEYVYSNGHKDQVEQQYHMLGTEKSTKITRKYDQYDNLIFEQYIEYTGNPLRINTFKYIYDEKGNWIEKMKYEQPCEKGVYETKKQVDHEIREIEYYKPNQQPRLFTLPLFPQKAKETKSKIPQWSVGAEIRKKAKKNEYE